MNSALVTLYRSLTRHRLYAILNIGGLALGIAVFLVLFLFVRFETSYDRVLPGWERVWKVERTIQFPGNPEFQIPSAPDLLGQLKAAFPDLAGARMTPYDSASVLVGRTRSARKVALVDPDYFRLFPFPTVEGDIASTLARPDGVVVTRAVAADYFGRTSALGRTLVITLDGKPVIYRVGAVIADLPANTTYRNDLYAAMPARPDPGQQSASYGVTTFLSLTDQAAAERIATFIRRHPDPQFNALGRQYLKQRITPLPSLHLADPHDRAIVGALGLVGLLALLVAIANYVNLATARAGLRAREVAIRKVVGASRRALIVQFLAEALATVVLAGLSGLALAELALPLVNAAGGTSLAIAYVGRNSILPPLALVVGMTGLVAGLYPALVLSRFRPAAVLASVRAPGGQRAGALLRRVMVVGQFAIATALMIGTAVLVAQTRHMQASDIGFARDGLIAVSSYADRTLEDAQRRAFATAVAAMPGVVASGEGAVAPGGGSFSIGPMHREGASGADPMIVRANIGRGFFATYRVHLLAGRLLDSSRYPGDVSVGKRERQAIVLNRTAVRLLGFASPEEAVGKTVGADEDGSATIVGVIADMRFKSPRDAVEPQAYYERGYGLPAVFVLRHAGDAAPMLGRLEGEWRRIAPTVPFVALPVDRQLYDLFYRADVQRSRLFLIGAVLAVVIGCIGLYGLAAFDTARRVKEIGIRKTLGASTADVLRLLIGQFLQPVLLANVIAVPLAWWAMRTWLAGFDDRIALSPWLFLAAMLLAAGIAIATILGQTWRVARSEPARALRYE